MVGKTLLCIILIICEECSHLGSAGVPFRHTYSEADAEGRYLILQGTFDREPLTILNRYAPNTDDQAFYDNMLDLLETGVGSAFIRAGDFNCVMDGEKDHHRAWWETKPLILGSLTIVMHNVGLRQSEEAAPGGLGVHLSLKNAQYL